jgi:Na+/phosphate symporter
MLAAMPKCPVCLTAYIALITGIICPAGTASVLMHAVVVVCVALLFIPLVRLVRRFCNC